MAPPIQMIEQNFIDMHHDRLTVETILESAVTADTISKLLADAPAPRAIGLAPGYTTAGKLLVLAIAVRSKIVLIHLQTSPRSKKQQEAVAAARGVIQRELLAGRDNSLYCFDMAPLAANLFLATRLRVHNAIDVQAACDVKDNRVPGIAIEYAVNLTRYRVNKVNIDRAFSTDLWDPEKALTTTSVAQRAWVASFLPTIGEMEEKFRAVKPIHLDAAHWPDEVSNVENISFGHFGHGNSPSITTPPPETPAHRAVGEHRPPARLEESRVDQPRVLARERHPEQIHRARRAVPESHPCIGGESNKFTQMHSKS